MTIDGVPFIVYIINKLTSIESVIAKMQKIYQVSLLLKVRYTPLVRKMPRFFILLLLELGLKVKTIGVYEW